MAVRTKACTSMSFVCSDPVEAEFSIWVKARAYCRRVTGSPCSTSMVSVVLAARYSSCDVLPVELPVSRNWINLTKQQQELARELVLRAQSTTEGCIRAKPTKVSWCFEPSQPHKVSWCFEPSQPQKVASGLSQQKLVGALSPVNHRRLHQG